MRFSKLITALQLLALTACAEPPLHPNFMVIETGMVETLPANPILDHNISLGSVIVAGSAIGDATVVGVVTPEALRQALQYALTTSGFYQRDKTAAKYLLNADLTGGRGRCLSK